MALAIWDWILAESVKMLQFFFKPCWLSPVKSKCDVSWISRILFKIKSLYFFDTEHRLAIYYDFFNRFIHYETQPREKRVNYFHNDMIKIASILTFFCHRCFSGI
jgi:hypothetical protein